MICHGDTVTLPEDKRPQLLHGFVLFGDNEVGKETQRQRVENFIIGIGHMKNYYTYTYRGTGVIGRKF